MNIERIYDLKGSKKGRIVSLTSDEQLTKSGLKVLKDLNLLQIKEHIQISKNRKEKMLDIIFNDTLFLRQNRLMDYSLLLIKCKTSKYR